MENTVLLGWLSLDRLLYSLLRVAFVWLAFHGAGSLLLRISNLKKHFSLLPAVVPGMLLYIFLMCVLSSVQLMTRSVVPMFLIPGGLAGAVFLYPDLKKTVSGFGFRRENLALLPLAVLAGFIVTTDFMIAGRPDMSIDDPQVTYTVQPDRWLNDGRMSVLDETIFSGLPMTSEIISVMPLSMSEDRLDQLILSQIFQIFQMSMLLAAIICGVRILRLGHKFLPAAIIGIGGCSILVIWAQFAKPDSTALFFTTVALCILLRQLTDRKYGSDLSAFLPMGMALATKPTAYLAVVPFAVMLFLLLKREGWSVSRFLWGILLISILPLIFAFRTIGLTGSPFYPFASIRMLLKPEWVKPAIELSFFDLIDRSSGAYEHYSMIENVWHYFRTWEAAIFLGFVLSFKRIHLRQRVIILAAIGAYALLSLILFYPAWWGAKYGIMLIPFAALFGLQMLKRLKRGLLMASLIAATVYLVFDTSCSPTEHYSVGYRMSLYESYSTRRWAYERFPSVVIGPELYAQLWMNDYLPEGSTVLSLFDKKRYLSNHRYIVAWRYPLAARLFLENSLEDELDILVDLGVDYIVCRTVDPVPFDGENNLEILSRRGIGDILEPVAEINDHTVYRFEPVP